MTILHHLTVTNYPLQHPSSANRSPLRLLVQLSQALSLSFDTQQGSDDFPGRHQRSRTMNNCDYNSRVIIMFHIVNSQIQQTSRCLPSGKDLNHVPSLMPALNRPQSKDGEQHATSQVGTMVTDPWGVINNELMG